MEKRQISLSRSESSVGVMEVNNKSFLLFSLKEAIKKKLNFSFSQVNWFGVAWWLCKVVVLFAPRSQTVLAFGRIKFS